MKTRYFTQTLVALLFSSFAFAASMDADREWNNEHRYAVSVDPFGWTGGDFRLGFEASVNDRLSFFMPIRFGFKKLIMNNNFPGTYFMPYFGAKYYVTGKAAHQGFYVNPLVGFSYSKTDAAGSEAQFGLSYAFRFGYAWNIWHGFWLDSYFGYEDVAAAFSKVAGTDNANNANFNILNGGLGAFDVGLLIGYSW